MVQKACLDCKGLAETIDHIVKAIMKGCIKETEMHSLREGCIKDLSGVVSSLN